MWIEHPRFTRAEADFVLVSLDPLVEIPIIVREWCPRGMVELEPKAALPAAKRFEAWIVPRSGKRELVATFTSGIASTSKPPGKPSLVAHEDTTSDARCGHAIILEGKKEAPLYAIWDRPGAYDTPPSAIVSILRIEEEDACKGGVGSWSSIAIRPMDLAGHLGEPIELPVGR